MNIMYNVSDQSASLIEGWKHIVAFRLFLTA